MSTVPEIFASKVFDDKVMRARLPEKVYKSLRKTIDNGERGCRGSRASASPCPHR